MSGKGKQRTKGNVKPSSSARAAELLAAEGHAIRTTIGFTGFGGVSFGSEGDLGAIGTADEPIDLDDDFRCSFRKAMKKDTVTKVKALREITALIAEKDPKAVSIAWQCWPRLYAKLALDGNFKVRELAHSTLGSFALKQGRQIVGQIKNIVPYWIIGEHDPYQLAAQAARQTFQESFPVGKRKEVLAFCKEAIITQCGPLVFSVDEVGGENASTSGEESPENRSARLSAGALWAIHTLVSSVDAEELQSIQEKFQQVLFSSPKFWNLGTKAKPITVRVAWFNLISAFIRYCHTLVSDKTAKLVPAIINTLDEKETSIIGASWACVASYVDVDAPEFWQACNFSKSFLPRLISVTRKAFYGCSVAIGPAVTRILRDLPPTDDRAGVYGKILAAFHAGYACILETKTSQKEAAAFIGVHCDYCIIICNAYQHAPEFVSNFLTDPEQSLFFITACSKSQQLPSEAFGHFADLLAFVIDQLPFKEPGLADSVSIFQSNLLQSIRYQLELKPSPHPLSNLLTNLREKCTGLEDECAAIARLCWELFGEKRHPEYANIFRSLFCSSSDIGDFSLRIQRETDPSRAVDQLSVSFLDHLNSIDAGSQATDALDDVVDCCFALLPALNQDQKKTLMLRLCQLRRFEAQYHFLSKLHTLEIDSVVEYIPKEDFTRLFMDCFKSTCSSLSSDQSTGNQGNQWTLFVDYLAGRTTERSVLPKEVVVLVLEHLTSLVEAEDRRKLPLVLTLVAQLTSEIIGSRPDLLRLQSGLSLVVQLFDITCMHSDGLTEETVDCLKGAWRTALKSSIATAKSSDTGDRIMVLIPLANCLLRHVKEADLQREKLEWICSIAMEIIATCEESVQGAEEKSTLLHSILLHLLPFHSLDMDQEAGDLWKMNAAVSGHFPLLQLSTLDPSNFNVVDCAKNSIGYLNLAAYGLRFGHQLYGSSSLIPFLDPSLHDHLSIVSIWGFSAVSYIHHVLELFSVMEINDGIASSLKSFGSWTCSLTVQFWSSLQPNDRANIAGMAKGTVLKSGSLATAAMEFLQYDLRDEQSPMPDRYGDEQFIAAHCAAESLAKNYVIDSFPDTSSIGSMIGFLHMASAGDHKAKMATLDLLISARTDLEDWMLFSCDVGSAKEDTILFNISLMRFLSEIVQYVPEISNEQRDFILCAILTWLQSCAESSLSNYRVQFFSIFAVRLFSKTASFMASLNDGTNAETLTEEWNGFFLKGCVVIIGLLFYKLSKQPLTTPLLHYLLRELSMAIGFGRKGDVDEFELSPLLEPELDSLGYPEKLQTLVLNTFPLLEDSKLSTQVAAFSVLEKFVDDFYEHECKNVKESESGETRELPMYFLNSLNSAFERIDEELDHLHSLETSPSFPGYLLTWKLFLRFFSLVKTDDRPALTSSMVSSKLLDKLMLTLFSILPEAVSSIRKTEKVEDTSNSEMNGKLSQCGKAFEEAVLESVLEVDDVSAVFLEPPSYTAGTSTTSFVQRYACHILMEVLRAFPAAIRHWFNSQERKMANLVERFVVKYVSPLLCASEINTITKGDKKYDNMTLVARPAAREVLASYKLEEFTMELLVTLPQNYPLSAATVDVSNRVGVSVEQWRKWMLQLTVFLLHQNGNLLDGMLLWKRCIDKHLQGVEDCMICMMAVHGSNYQLPKITCRQCKKKFHAACLYKWFNTSSNTSCPLCRTTF